MKLFATLGTYLPPGAARNAATVTVEEGADIAAVLARLGVPREQVHLALVNGVYIAPERLAETRLAPGDTLALWPPVAGG
ncbi:MAG TPA: MoaD/ThiS family protein [Candidatus Competibacteraceae bacterium]|nr:MoaD/ThiS family protein [Candidatus Competibacteraceae bacterium]